MPREMIKVTIFMTPGMHQRARHHAAAIGSNISRVCREALAREIEQAPPATPTGPAGRRAAVVECLDAIAEDILRKHGVEVRS